MKIDTFRKIAHMNKEIVKLAGKFKRTFGKLRVSYKKKWKNLVGDEGNFFFLF